MRDIADEMGPAGLTNNLDLVMASLEQLLEKSARCQIKMGGDDMDDSDE